MGKTEKTGLDYMGGRILPLFLKTFFPTLLGMLFNALITFIDGVFVGRGVGPDGIAAVNIIVPLYMVTTGIGLMFGIGSSVTAGISLASNNNSKANQIISSSFLFASILIVCIALVCFSFPESLARFLGCSDRLMPYALDYLSYLLIGLLPIMWQSIGMMVIRLDGSPKYAMMCNVVPAVLNIGLDWWFIFPLGMGVKGAALATSLSCIVGGLMAVTYFRFSYVLKFTCRIKNFRLMIWQQAKVGSAAFITEVAMSVMMFTGNVVFMKYFRESGVAAYSIACYLFPLIFMISNAVAQSAQPIISVNYGAGLNQRVRQALNVSLRTAVICGVISTLGITLGARTIVGIFIPLDSEAARIAVYGLPIFATAAIFFAINIAYIGYCQSIEQSVRALSYTLLRGILLLVPLFFLMPAIFPAWGMWGAIPVSEFLTLLIILLTFNNRK